jgi:cytochrome c biogenesis protein CcmG/thiol:disulfide interchange protein DsbE
LRVRLLIPLAVFMALAAFLLAGLFRNPTEVPSPLINKPAPDFDLPRLDEPNGKISSKDMAGKVWLLNVWASWCVSCRAEHPVLMELSHQNLVPIYGLNYKDRREDALGWLRDFGNPYVTNAVDRDGRVGMDYGVYGVPETYVIDAHGVIRYKQIGPITPDVLQGKILPLIRELQG